MTGGHDPRVPAGTDRGGLGRRPQPRDGPPPLLTAPPAASPSRRRRGYHRGRGQVNLAKEDRGGSGLEGGG